MNEDRIHTKTLRQVYDHITEADATVRAALLMPTADQVVAAVTARANLNAALAILEEVQS